MIWINFKTYEQGTGEKAQWLAGICQRVSKQTSIEIIPVVQAADIFRLTRESFKVWAQHVDNISFGPNTGHILPEAIAEGGAEGTVLNHSENKLSIQVIEKTVRRCRELKIKTLVCSESVSEGEEISKFKPDFLAYEPPELIGGNLSVALAKPEIIADFFQRVPGIPLVIGAGIHTAEDIKKGLQLGAKGFLISSDVVLATDPEKELIELAKGFL